MRKGEIAAGLMVMWIICMVFIISGIYLVFGYFSEEKQRMMEIIGIILFGIGSSFFGYFAAVATIELENNKHENAEN